MARRLSLLVALMVVCAGVSAQERLVITPELVAAAEKEGEVTIQYSAPLVAMQAQADDFTKLYPNIRLNLERKAGSSGVQALTQEAAAGVHRIDVFQGSDTGANAAVIAQGLALPVLPDEIATFLPSATAMSPHVFYPDLFRCVVQYNPKFVTEAEAEKLKTWEGILDPVFKGRISLVEPTFGVTLAPLLYIMNTPSLGAEFLRKLKAQQPSIFVNTAQARDAVVSGQRPISWGAQWESVVMSDVERGAPVRFVYPSPTVEYGGDGWAIMAKAPRPNAARLFFAWIMSKPGASSILGPAYNSLSSRTDVQDTRAIVTKLRAQSWFKEPSNVWSPDLGDWVKNGARYQEQWAKIMRSNG